MTPILFYEHSTLERLAQYLHTTYAYLLAPHFAGASPISANVTVHDQTDRGTEAPVTRQYSRVAFSPVDVSEQKAPATASSIAIIGISGAFPQAPDVQSFWHNLHTGRDCIGEIPQERWDWHTYFGNTATEVNTTNIKWAGVVEDIDTFDPQFFGISPREAELMDPQQRLLMMYVWKAIEDAGYAAESLSGTKTALFVGTGGTGYGTLAALANITIEGHFSTGLASSIGPNRISYFLNLHGPSEPIETACSSSLVAIHRGVHAIESGECSVAIVGGVNTLVSPEAHISFSKAGMLSEDGRCKSFSAAANGYVRSDGVGILVLKKLADAEQAGDHIYGVIRASTENHGGHATSLTA
ncbi:MAG: polyketide synthase, partial [Chloroflexi bacterium]